MPKEASSSSRQASQALKRLEPYNKSPAEQREREGIREISHDHEERQRLLVAAFHGSCVRNVKHINSKIKT